MTLSPCEAVAVREVRRPAYGFENHSKGDGIGTKYRAGRCRERAIPVICGRWSHHCAIMKRPHTVRSSELKFLRSPAQQALQSRSCRAVCHHFPLDPFAVLWQGRDAIKVPFEPCLSASANRPLLDQLSRSRRPRARLDGTSPSARIRALVVLLGIAHGFKIRTIRRRSRCPRDPCSP